MTKIEKYLTAEEQGACYTLIDGKVYFNPMLANEDTPNQDEWYPVEPELVGEETVPFMGTRITLNTMYRVVKLILSN